MKKWMALFLFCLFAAQGNAFAIAHDSPEYEKMREYKRQQREKRELEKVNPQTAEKGFWQKEAERSGLAGTFGMLNPVAWEAKKEE